MKIYKVILDADISKLTLDISCAERRLHLKQTYLQHDWLPADKHSPLSIFNRDLIELLLYMYFLPAIKPNILQPFTA